MKFEGQTYKCGNDVNTDVIIPARYLVTIDPKELAEHAMEDLDKEFLKKPHDIIVAGDNFGCGSSREHAVIALQASGVKAVIAKSFARIFFRNAINLGIPAIVCKDADKIEGKVSIDLEKGEIENNNNKYTFTPLTGVASDILSVGGLIPYLKKKLGKG